MKHSPFIFVLVIYLSFGPCRPAPLSCAAPQVQFERLGPYGGDVRSLLINFHDPQIVYLGTSDGQIYKSTDAGVSWYALVPGIGRRQFVVDTLVQHPDDPDRVYAGAWDLRSNGGGLFESRDAGLTWNQIPLPLESTAVRDFSICRDKPSYMLVGALDGVFLSDDAGEHWKQVGSNFPELKKVKSVAIHPRDPNIVYGGTWRLAYRSVDFGKSWTRVEQGMHFDSDVFSLCIDPENPDILFASACSGIYRSDDRGGSWTRLRVLPNRFGVRTHIVYRDPLDAHRIYGGTTEGLFVSRDDGQTWKRITSQFLTVNAIQVNPKDNEEILLGTDDHGVMRSTDGGRTWHDSNLGFVHRQISRIIPDPEGGGQFFTGILSDGREGGFYLLDSRNQWEPLTAEIVATGAEVLSFLALPGQRGKLAGTARGLHWQKSGSTPWSKLPGDIARAVINDLAFDSKDSWIFAATNEGVYRARPDKLDFQRPREARLKPNVFSLVVSPGSPTLVYAGSSSGVLRSADGGEKWEICSAGLPPRSQVESLAVCPAEREHIFAGTVAGLFETNDGGVSWRKVRDGRLGVEVPSVIFLDVTGKRIMAADKTFEGVFLSEDGGERWEKIAAPEFASPVRYLAQDPTSPHQIYVGTHSEGVYRLNLLNLQ